MASTPTWRPVAPPRPLGAFGSASGRFTPPPFSCVLGRFAGCGGAPSLGRRRVPHLLRHRSDGALRAVACSCLGASLRRRAAPRAQRTHDRIRVRRRDRGERRLERPVVVRRGDGGQDAHQLAHASLPQVGRVRVER